MRGKQRVALLVLLVALALLGATFLFPRDPPEREIDESAPTQRTRNIDTRGPPSVFAGVECAADDALCEIQGAQGGINVVPNDCSVLYLEKYKSGVALFTDLAKTKRLVPNGSNDGDTVREVAAGGSEATGPYFAFGRLGENNMFYMIVNEKFVRFGDSGAAEISQTPGPVQVIKDGSRGIPHAVLLLDATIVGGVLRRGPKHPGVRLYVALKGSHGTNVCAPAVMDELALYSLNSTSFEAASDASRSIAMHTCLHVGEWASKPRMCIDQCERAFPQDAPWCAWAARVDPIVATRAEGAGQCCRTIKEVAEVATRVRPNANCAAENERWVKVPYANGAFTADVKGGEIKQIEIPAYATIAIRLSRLGHFSASC